MNLCFIAPFSKAIEPTGHHSIQYSVVPHSKRTLGNYLNTCNAGSKMSKITSLVFHFNPDTSSSKKLIYSHQNKYPSKPQKQFNAYIYADNTMSEL